MRNKLFSRAYARIEDIGRHLKLALRVFRKQPGFAFAVTILLALGVGSVTAVFGIMNELMFKPRFAIHPEQLYAISAIDDRGKNSPFHVSPPYLEEYLHLNDPSYRIFGFALLQPKLQWGEQVERTKVELVSGNYFGLLGIRPVAGRFLDQQDDRERGGGRVAVISDRLWHRRFNSTSETVGQNIEINGQKITIVGIAPLGFHGLDTWDSDIWLPASAEPLLKEFTIYKMALRKARGSSLPAVKAKLSAATREIVRKYNSKPPPGYENYGTINQSASLVLLSAARGRLSPFANHPEIWTSFWLYVAIVGAVLVIACANIGNLMLVRTLQREREIAIRVALGASWRVLLKHSFAEGFVFATLGAGFGMILSVWLNRILLSWSPPETRFMAEMSIDLRVLGFALLLSTVAALTFGLAPALYALRERLFDSLRVQSGAATGPHSHALLQRSFVACQIAICVVLLTGAGLCFRSFNRLAAVRPGFQTENILFLGLDLEAAGYQKEVASVHVGEIVERLRSLPNTEMISFAKSLALNGQKSFFGVYNLDGYEKRPGEQSIMVPRSQVGPNYFSAMGIPLLSGNELVGQGGLPGKQVIVVNESFVQRYWPKLNPIGRQIFGFEVIGVARDSRNYNLWEPAEPHLYFQSVNPASLNPSFIIRTSRNPMHLVPGLRAAVNSYNSNIKITEIITVDDLMRRSLADRRFALQLLGCLGAIAMLLSAVGTYGLMSYLVSRRAQEIGVRMALGAGKRDILLLVMRYGAVLGLTGIGLGLIGAVAATRLMTQWLYEVNVFDATTLTITCILMFVTATLASFLPARRAANVDPMNALRSE